MIVTLREDIPQLGKKNERVKVSDAYARNVLVPQNKAFVGEQTVFRVTADEKTIDYKQVQQALQSPLLFTESANEKGTLYKKIGHKDIVARIASVSGVPVTRVSLEKDFEPLDHVGEYTVKARVGEEIYSIRIVITQS